MHKYQLQKYSGLQSRHRCPVCQHRRKTFTFYIDTETNQPLNPKVGKCEREIKCGYHFTPRQYFLDHGQWSIVHSRKIGGNGVHSRWPIDHSKKASRNLNVCQPSNISYGLSTIDHGLKSPATINYELFKASLARYDQNHLITFLRSLFGIPVTNELIAKYHIGTAKHWPGATVFWQIDSEGKVRTGKIMLYNAVTGKRVKQPFNHITWVHALLRKRYERLDMRCETKDSEGAKNLNTQISHLISFTQCYFGEHLLQANNLPVAIVESEKTALIASVLLPGFTWLAIGSLTNLSPQKFKVLKGRQVYLFPDLNAFERWQAKAKQLYHIGGITVSNLLETHANAVERDRGLDIADYLMENGSM